MAGTFLAVFVLISIPVKSNGDSDLISRISKLQFPQSLLNKTGKPVIKIPPFGRLMQYVPKGKQLKEKRLRRRLGEDFDKFWMSVDEPVGEREDTLATGPNYVRLQVLQDIENFAKSYIFQTENTTAVVDDTVSFFKTMISYGSCKVNYKWEDLSILFWPRWVKQGSCNTDHEVSCSYPSGMFCSAVRSKVIKLLRWTCKRKRKGSKRQKKKNKTEDRQKTNRFPGVKCRWKKVPFPVTAECLCTC